MISKLPVDPTRALDEFWQYACQTTDYAVRMTLLEQTATREIVTPKGWPKPAQVRKEWQRSKLAMPMANCFACLEREAEERHHIVPIQSGGLNEKRNIVWLCRQCHNRVHPWLAEWRLNHILQKQRKRIDRKLRRHHRKIRRILGFVPRVARVGTLQTPRDMRPRLVRET